MTPQYNLALLCKNKLTLKCKFIKLCVAYAHYRLAKMYEHGQYVTKNVTHALMLYQKSADSGYTHAQLDLGVMFYYGNNVTQDYAQAIYWYHNAAIQGNITAQYSLGKMYGKGEGVKSDYKKAFYWYCKANSFLQYQDKNQINTQF